MSTAGRHYRARKAIEYKYLQGLTNKEIADKLDVTAPTVSEYLNDPPEDFEEPIQHIKSELTLATFNRLRDQLEEIRERAETAEKPEKVFAKDANGELVTQEIELEGGGTKVIPVVEDMELVANEEVKYYCRQEERQIIEMLWDLAGVKEPDKHEVEHSGDGIMIQYGNDTTQDD